MNVFLNDRAAYEFEDWARRKQPYHCCGGYGPWALMKWHHWVAFVGKAGILARRIQQ
ncbi:hypothetical protein K2W90_03760 [Candidatus Babeliales bacterium]|nr:hypothetical protein [Candidatus Babeliales bacterium]